MNRQTEPNPVNFAIRTTGILALIFLILTLAITPVSRVTRQGWLGQFRRLMGLCAFAHASLHFGLFFGFDRSGRVGDTLLEVVRRPYLLVGTTALILMVPLAATSTDAMIRRLGGRRWKALHRLTYPIAVLGALHFFMLVKADTTRPLAFAGVLGVFLGYRPVARYARLRSDARQRRASASVVPATPAAPAVTGLRPWKGHLKVARIFEETPDVRTFRLVPLDGVRLPFDFLPGQYLNVALRVNETRVNRSYTIASSPTRSGYCEITVKREGSGVASRHLHDDIHEGDAIEVLAPSGRFTLTGDEAEGLALIAGGVGITPLMAKVRYLTDRGWPGPIDLVVAARTEADIIFRDELAYLERRFPNLHVTITLTREADPAWTGERGRVSVDLLRRIVPEIAARRVHLCGPADMMAAVPAMLRALGVPDEQVHVESFARARRSEAEAEAEAEANANLAAQSLMGVEAPDSPPAPNGLAATASITFAASGKSQAILLRQTVLEVAEALGVRIPYDCRAGICGQCRTRLLAGHVAMDADDALNATDRAGGFILACQAHCLDAVVVGA